MKLLAGGVLFIASLPSLLTHFSRVKHAVHTTGAVLIQGTKQKLLLCSTK
jgi:hypothetical protein